MSFQDIAEKARRLSEAGANTRRSMLTELEREFDLPAKMTEAISHEPALLLLGTKLRLRATLDTPTLGVGVNRKTLNFELAYNPLYLKSLPKEHLSNKLIHELYHMMLGHVSDLSLLETTKAVVKNPKTALAISSLAMDLAVNSMITKAGKSPGLLPEGDPIPGYGPFASFPANLTSEAYLDLLLEQFKQNPPEDEDQDEEQDSDGDGDSQDENKSGNSKGKSKKDKSDKSEKDQKDKSEKDQDSDGDDSDGDDSDGDDQDGDGGKDQKDQGSKGKKGQKDQGSDGDSEDEDQDSDGDDSEGDQDSDDSDDSEDQGSEDQGEDSDGDQDSEEDDADGDGSGDQDSEDQDSEGDQDSGDQGQDSDGDDSEDSDGDQDSDEDGEEDDGNSRAQWKTPHSEMSNEQKMANTGKGVKGDHSGFVMSQSSDPDDPMDQGSADAAESALTAVLGELEQEIRERGTGWGSVSSEVRGKIMDRFRTRPLDWRSLLAQFVGRLVEGDNSCTYTRLNRRMPYEYPGYRIGQRARIGVFVDQSGSMSDELLALLFSQLDTLAEEIEFVYCPFDHIVFEKHVMVWEAGTRPRIQRIGNGGTNFDPAVEFTIENGFEGIIMVTDMGANKPRFSPVPRLWLTDEQGKRFNDNYDVAGTDQLVVVTPLKS